jgi:hypothetical protein
MDPTIIDKIREAIQSNNYLTLATVDSSGLNPLATPVFFACNAGWNGFDSNSISHRDARFVECRFYWISSVQSQHSLNIQHNSHTSIVIFDSTAKLGDGFGVFMTGTSKMIVNHDEIKIADEAMRVKCNSNEIRSADYYCDPHPRRIYKFTPTEIWINTRVPQDGQLIDQRMYITGV